jgi:hypothetical protein
MELNVKQNIQFEINIEDEEMFLYFDKEFVNNHIG